MSEVDDLRKALTWALENGHFIERRKVGPGSRRYECCAPMCRSRGFSPEAIVHSSTCEYAKSWALLRETAASTQRTIGGV